MRKNNSPELTVSMPVYNTSDYIKESINSVLSQEGVDIELIVVNDCSQDTTAEILQSYKDQRLKIINNDKRRGIGYCHNQVINKSRAPFIAHVDSDDIIAPGALKKVVDKIKEDERIGQVHSYYFIINEQGFASRSDFRKRKSLYVKPFNKEIDYKSRLLRNSWVANHLRTYNKKVFDEVGQFNEKLTFGIDYDMALRIIDRYEITQIPEGLYYYRKHKTNTTRLPNMTKLRMYLQKKYIIWNLIEGKSISFVSKIDIIRVISEDLLSLIKKNSFDVLIKIMNTNIELFRNLIINRISGIRKFYEVLADKLSWWPISLMHINTNSTNNPKIIAYYLWKYPVLSQTFIQREIKALRDCGTDIKVFRDKEDDYIGQSYIDNNLSKDVYSLTPVDKSLLIKYSLRFFITSPVNFINIFLYIAFHRYSETKLLNQDLSVFKKAIYLAGHLKDHGITHIHAPWANKHSFIALIGSKIAGATYSVQARAYDIHRNTHKYGMKEKFDNAKFVITNTIFNLNYLSKLIDSKKTRIHQIYNGIDLDNFISKAKNNENNNIVEILTVGRIVEQKGFEYLLRACSLLVSNGKKFNCNLIGDTRNLENFNYYLKLKKLHKSLGLDDCFHFVGAKPFTEVMEYFTKADLFVLPCVVAEDGSCDIIPNVVLEAMAMKIPVVSTTITGVPEMVEDGKTGFLVKERDENALADAMEKLINDSKLRATFGENARKRVECLFDINKNISNYSKLFSS